MKEVFGFINIVLGIMLALLLIGEAMSSNVDEQKKANIEVASLR